MNGSYSHLAPGFDLGLSIGPLPHRKEDAEGSLDDALYDSGITARNSTMPPTQRDGMRLAIVLGTNPPNHFTVSTGNSGYASFPQKASALAA